MMPSFQAKYLSLLVMSAFTRPVILLLAGLMLFTISLAALNTQVPLWLKFENLSTLVIGLVASSYFVGNLIGALGMGWVITMIGFNRSYYLACIIFAAATIGLYFSFNPVYWGVSRLFAGIACAMVWVIVESALLRSGTLATRGILLAGYMVVYYLGTIIGQLLLAVLPTTLNSVLVWCSVLFIIAIIPVMLVQVENTLSTVKQKKQTVSLISLAKRRDILPGTVGCFVSGVVIGSLYSLLPLYLLHMALSNSEIALSMAILVGAGIIGQFPIGILSNKYGRLYVLRLLVSCIAVTSLLILMQLLPLTLILLILGAVVFTFYPVAMAWACEKSEHDELMGMNQMLLINYTVGSLIGPAITAGLMEYYQNDSLLFVVVALANVCFLVLLFDKTNSVKFNVK